MTQTPPLSTGELMDKRPRARLSFQLIQTASVLLLTVVLCVVSSFKSEGFFSWYNLVENVFTNAAALGIIACGMTFVMISGGFDLSVASTTVVCTVVTVLALQALAPYGAWVAIPLALLAAMVVGTLLGSVNGALIAYVGVNPFVVTLSTMLIFRGIALIITHGGQSIQVPLEFQDAFGKIYWGEAFSITAEYPILVPMVMFAVVFLVGVYVLRMTRFGHYVYAVGGNENASWLAGVSTHRVKATCYAICGFTCALAAMIFASQSNTAQAGENRGLEMQVIASVIVGGTPLGGGSGSLLRTLNGLLLLAVIENMLGQFGIREEYRNIVRGVIIIVVVTVDLVVRRRSGK